MSPLHSPSPAPAPAAALAAALADPIPFQAVQLQTVKAYAVQVAARMNRRIGQATSGPRSLTLCVHGGVQAGQSLDLPTGHFSIGPDVDTDVLLLDLDPDSGSVAVAVVHTVVGSFVTVTTARPDVRVGGGPVSIDATTNTGYSGPHRLPCHVQIAGVAVVLAPTGRALGETPAPAPRVSALMMAALLLAGVAVVIAAPMGGGAPTPWRVTQAQPGAADPTIIIPPPSAPSWRRNFRPPGWRIWCRCPGPRTGHCACPAFCRLTEWPIGTQFVAIWMRCPVRRFFCLISRLPRRWAICL